MRKTKRIVFTLVLAIATLLGTAAWYVTRPRPKLLVENYPLVRKGMSQAEVEALLGGPPGNYGCDPNLTVMSDEGYLPILGSVEKVWCDDRNRLEVYFKGGVVVGHLQRHSYSQTQMPSGGWLDRSWRIVRRIFN